MPLAPKPPSASATEMVQVVLPNDANPMGFMLGGAVMHLIDIAGAIAAFRHARELCDGGRRRPRVLNPIKVGDFIVLKARVTGTFTTSLEVEVTVFSEEALTGRRQMTSRAYLTFVTLEQEGGTRSSSAAVETDEEKQSRPPRGRRANVCSGGRRLGGSDADECGWISHASA